MQRRKSDGVLVRREKRGEGLVRGGEREAARNSITAGCLISKEKHLEKNKREYVVRLTVSVILPHLPKTKRKEIRRKEKKRKGK